MPATSANLPAERPVRGKLVTFIELAEWSGYSTDALRKDVQNGCPVHRRGLVGGTGTVLNSHEWYKWKLERARYESRGRPSSTSPIVGDAKERALEATAGKREAELAKMRGEMINIADLDALISDEFVTLRTALLGLEEELRPEIGAVYAKRAQEFVIAAVNRSVDEAENIPDKLAEVR